MKYVQGFLQVALLALAVFRAAHGQYDAACYNLLWVLVIEFTLKRRG